jgi:hypothetical protein
VRPVIYPYSLASQSARDLARALGTFRVRENGNYIPRPHDLLIVWGNPRVPGWWDRNARANALNQPEAVRNAINKVVSFRMLRDAGVPVPDFAVNRGEAERFFRSPRSRVLCRTMVNGHSGRGITIAVSPASLIRCPLYVKYVPKEREYRLHVLNDNIIDIEQKRRRNGVEQNDQERLIRSHRHGWIFARNNVDTPTAQVRRVAIDAVRALGLSFGAVDIGWHSEFGTKVYEVNTAPGIEGTTLEIYTERFAALASTGKGR